MGGGGSGGAGSAQYPDTQQLFVGNLPHNCTEQDLEILFGKYGKVNLGVFQRRHLPSRVFDFPRNPGKTQPLKFPI